VLGWTAAATGAGFFVGFFVFACFFEPPAMIVTSFHLEE
jgi:hypothetical protein